MTPEAINPAGAQAGCHTCGTPDPGTQSGNWRRDCWAPLEEKRGNAIAALPASIMAARAGSRPNAVPTSGHPVAKNRAVRISKPRIVYFYVHPKVRAVGPSRGDLFCRVKFPDIHKRFPVPQNIFPVRSPRELSKKGLQQRGFELQFRP